MKRLVFWFLEDPQRAVYATEILAVAAVVTIIYLESQS